MLKLSFRREREKEFRHISHGLIPAASVAPKPAVPRTPPPRSPDPSPERPRSALAAAILSSSLTGQTWALPPTYPRAFTESDPSESVNYEPTLFQRETWAEDVQSAEPSEGELDGRAALKEIHDEEHVYQTINTAGESETNEPVYALPVKPKATSQQLTGTSGHDPDFDRFNDAHEQAPKRSQESFRKELDRKSTRKKNKARSMEEIQAKNIVSRLSGENVPAGPSTPISTSASQIKAETSEDNKVKMDPAPSQRQRASAPEMIQRQSSFNPRDKKQDSISQAEVQSLRRQAQELVDENDALKMTVHRLNVELSRYQVRFRPLSKEEISKTEGLPVTDSAPPWLLDMKYLSPLLLSYEDRMKEKDALLKTTEEEMKRLRVHVEQVIKENDKLHEDISKMGGVTQTDWERLQEQAVLVLQENQLLIEQLDEESVKAKRTQSKHHSEVSKLAKQLMLCEAEKHHLEEELEASKREAQKNTRNAQTLQDRLKDAVTWEEHCNIAGKLKCQLEQMDLKNKRNEEELFLKTVRLEEENSSLNLEKENLNASIRKLKMELETWKQAYGKAEGKLSLLRQQKEESVLKEEKTQHYLEAVVSVAEHISLERNYLLHMASALEQEKQRFICKILNGTVRLGKLQKEVQVYRRQASSRLAELEQASEGSAASHRKEILHLQRLLGERQEAEERLLQSKRDVEEELEVVWQVATKENQQRRELFSSSRFGLVHKCASGDTDGTLTERRLT